MTNQQRGPSLETLIGQIDSIQGKFRAEAKQNRRERRNAESRERQKTVGDQPEQEFHPQVFLLIPHNNIEPAAAAFDSEDYETTAGSVVSFTVNLKNTSVATVIVGDEFPPDYEVAMTVVDGDGDGTVTVDMDTSRAGLTKYDVDTVYSTRSGGDSVRNIVRETVPNTQVGTGFVDYGLTARVHGTKTDTALIMIDQSASGSSGGTGDGSAERSTTVEARQRPLPRRPKASPPLRSSGLTVTHDGGRTSFIDPGKQYTVEAAIENAGGLGASGTTVELFVEHKRPVATIDTNNGTFEAVRGQQSRITGYTSLPPGQHLVGVAYHGSTLRHDNILWRSEPSSGRAPPIGETVTEDRTFDMLAWLADDQSSLTNFRIRLYWTTGIDLTKPKYWKGTTKSNKEFVQVLENDAVKLTDQQGRFVSSSPQNTEGPLDLTSTINETTLVDNGGTKVTVPTSGVATTTFDYTAPSSQNGRVLTVFHTRAYSLAPEDMPADWDELDHTQSRFMGRTELNWRGIAANH